jgi:type II secretory pathway predicted ATPase ExeA
MYLDFFNLREFPFRLTPDTEFLFMSHVHARAKAYMDYSVWNREGFVVITGEIGCGKTILLKKLLTELEDEHFLVAKIFQTQLDEVEFLQAVLVEFGLNPFNAKKVELIDMLNTFLVDSYREMKQLVLIVDDAHNLSQKALEEIRMLSGLETQKEKVLHVILVGQPQLNTMLDAPELEQLVQRVRLRFHLRPLGADETAEYIAHRLKVAGTTRTDLFTPETMSVIYKYTGGVPRLINTLCDTALTVAYADDLPTVTINVLKEALDELQWQPYERRASSNRTGKPAPKGDHSQTVREQDKLIAGIGNRLNQMDSLVPSLSLISDRMASIEALLTNIVALLRQGKTEHEIPSRKSSGKER